MAAACASVFLVSARAFGQATASSVRADDWKAWASLSLGPAAVDGEGHVGAMAALWATRGPLAFSVRGVGASRIFEAGDAGDISLLAGFHTLRARHADAVVLAGIGEGFGHDFSGGNLVREPVLAGSAQLNFNYVLIGAGLDAFVGVGATRRYYGVGFAFAVGAFGN
jgi:hypothetical protein